MADHRPIGGSAAGRVGGSGVPPGGLIPPMLASAGPIPTGPGWVFEIKFDGVRAVGYAAAGGWRLFSRNDREITASYPDVAHLPIQPGQEGLVLDGELVALDGHGRPDFSRLQQRMHVIAPSPALLGEVAVRYVVFDVLRDGQGRSLLDEPLTTRRQVLDGLDLGAAGVQVSPVFSDTPGELVMAAARQQGLEGVIAKRARSRYEPGRRSRAWTKTPIRRATEVIIAGWSPSTGRPNTLGSLQLAAHTAAGELVYAGDVGTGFTDAARRHLLAHLQALEQDQPPFLGEFVRARGWPGRPPAHGPVRWVCPVLVGEIEYRAFTLDGYFRHPSWRGLRPDRDPAEVLLPASDP